MSKRVLRGAMRGLVPYGIFDRKDKVGFATPWAHGGQGRHAAALEQRLADSANLLRDYVDRRRIQPGSRAALIVLSLASAVGSLTGKMRVALAS